MTELEYRKEIENLVFDAPARDRPCWPKWKLPDRQPGESQEHHLERLRIFKAIYFETVNKLECGRSLTDF